MRNRIELRRMNDAAEKIEKDKEAEEGGTTAAGGGKEDAHHHHRLNAAGGGLLPGGGEGGAVGAGASGFPGDREPGGLQHGWPTEPDLHPEGALHEGEDATLSGTHRADARLPRERLLLQKDDLPWLTTL